MQMSQKHECNFEKFKKSKLKGVDFSRKGSIDERIRRLVEKLNVDERYFTLSSCSGRVMITSKSKDNQKQNLSWHFTSHQCPTFDELKSNMKGGDSILKFEPFVLHVQCRDLESAKKLLTIALGSAFRNSGIIPSKGNRFVLAVRSTLTLELPITDNEGTLLVSNAQLTVLHSSITSKFSQNEVYIKRFEDAVLLFLESEVKEVNEDS